jgi:putative peptidoglycan lipid II flippase
LLVVLFAVRAGYLELDSALTKSLARFVVCGAVLWAALWFAAKFASVYLAPMSAFRDETVLLLLAAVGTLVYAFSIVLLFGRGWLRSLVRS